MPVIPSTKKSPLQIAISEGRAQRLVEGGGIGKLLIQYTVDKRNGSLIPEGMRNLKRQFETTPAAAEKAKRLKAQGRGTNKTGTKPLISGVRGAILAPAEFMRQAIEALKVPYYKVTADQDPKLADMRLLRISGKTDAHTVNYVMDDVIPTVTGLENLQGEMAVQVDTFPFTEGEQGEDMVIINFTRVVKATTPPEYTLEIDPNNGDLYAVKL